MTRCDVIRFMIVTERVEATCTCTVAVQSQITSALPPRRHRALPAWRVRGRRQPVTSQIEQHNVEVAFQSKVKVGEAGVDGVFTINLKKSSMLN